MKIWHSEFLQNYGTYTFGYGVYASLEKSDKLSAIYEQGFLPYSGSKQVTDSLYMARSARVSLPQFEPSSENRRILKKFDGVFTKSPVTAATFAEDKERIAFALSYFAKRHDAKLMPEERLKLILAHAVAPCAVQYEKDGKLAALTLLDGDTAMQHFWYSFYDLSMVDQSLGMWLMLDAARDAKAEGKEHFYVGTVYGEKALYKTNFPALSWWDGKDWQEDVSALKARARTDSERTAGGRDVWKSEEELF